jgi:hypothetical protein
MKKFIGVKFIYSILALIIWLQIYLAFTTEYDDNYAHLILSWIIWIASFVAIIVIGIKKREWLISNIYFLVIYMLLTNPFSLWFVMDFIMRYYGLHMAT